MGERGAKCPSAPVNRNKASCSDSPSASLETEECRGRREGRATRTSKFPQKRDALIRWGQGCNRKVKGVRSAAEGDRTATLKASKWSRIESSKASA